MLLTRRCVSSSLSCGLFKMGHMRSLSLFRLHPGLSQYCSGQYRQFSKILPSTSYSDESVKMITKEWIDKWVIGLKLCPFAPAVMKADKLRMVVKRDIMPNPDDHEAFAKYLEDFISESVALIGKETGLDEESKDLDLPTPEFHSSDTTMIILPKIKDYELFKVLVDTLESYLNEIKLSSLIQISSFHPLYKVQPRFENGQLLDTPVDVYTKRSPYPIIHLLKQGQLRSLGMAYTLKHNPPGSGGRGRVKNRERQVIEKMGETLDRIVTRNTHLMREMGLGKVRTTLRDLYAEAPITQEDKQARDTKKKQMEPPARSSGGSSGGKQTKVVDIDDD